jgi:MFS family permease
VLASLGTGALRWPGAGPGVVFGVAASIVLLAAFATRPVERKMRPATTPPRLFQRFPAWLLVIGALGATAYWIENTWQSWGAVHLERSFDASPGTSALGPALFATAMAARRLGVHWLTRPGAERAVLVAGAAVAGLGSALASLASSTPLAVLGIVVAGAGCSVCAPTIVSIAGRAAGAHERATIVGSVTTLMYLGFLVGPAAVGGLAQLTSLRISLAAVAGLAFLLSLLFALVALPRPRR